MPKQCTRRGKVKCKGPGAASVGRRLGRPQSLLVECNLRMILQVGSVEDLEVLDGELKDDLRTSWSQMLLP